MELWPKYERAFSMATSVSITGTAFLAKAPDWAKTITPKHTPTAKRNHTLVAKTNLDKEFRRNILIVRLTIAMVMSFQLLCC